MKKLIGLVLMLMIILSLVGCGKTENVFNEKITEIRSGTNADNNKSLSDNEREDVIKIFENTINHTNGKDYESIADEFIDGGFYLQFFNNKKEIVDLGLNGHYCIYKKQYYKMSDDKYDKLISILNNKNESVDLDSISNISLVDGCFSDVNFLDEESKQRLLKLVVKTINTSKEISKKQYNSQITYGGTAISFYDGAKLIQNVNINNKSLRYKDKYYKIPKKYNQEIKDLASDKSNYYPAVNAKIKKTEDKVLTIDVTKSTNKLYGTYEIEIENDTIIHNAENTGDFSVGDEVLFVYDGSMTKCLISKIFPIYMAKTSL